VQKFKINDTFLINVGTDYGVTKQKEKFFVFHNRENEEKIRHSFW